MFDLGPAAAADAAPQHNIAESGSAPGAGRISAVWVREEKLATTLSVADMRF
jgi:hypothetical protein